MSKTKKITVSHAFYDEMRGDYQGFCLSCNETAEGIEPDAVNYECEYCGKRQVFGIEVLLINGDLELVD